MFRETACCSDVNGTVLPRSSDTVVPAALAAAATAGAGAGAGAAAGAAGAGAGGAGAAAPPARADPPLG